MSLSQRPEQGEHPDYQIAYVSRVPDGPVDQTLELQLPRTLALVTALDDERALHRYAPGKWSVKEVLGHVIDTERVMAYRALRFARADQTPLPGFEQDDYVAAGGFDARPLETIIDEFRSVRADTLALFRGLAAEALLRTGTASGQPYTVRALAWVIAGHELHHRAILEERYGLG